MRGFFGPSGWLAANHPRYEFRPGQLEMAEMVETALREKRHAIIEAGTGTGKTLAYLVPALLSGQRVIVSTGTKNLQEQLFYKDVPFLQEKLGAALGREFRVCYMKGRANYLCRQKLLDIENNPPLGFLETPGELVAIREWASQTSTGDRAELTGFTDKNAIWRNLDARRDTCTGQKCAQFDRCFLTEMHRRALESDLIIVNHHLFFADLALKHMLGDEVPDIGIIPSYSAVIFDEAHELEDVASDYFGCGASNYRLEELVRDCDFVLRAKQCGSPAVYEALRRAADRGARFFDLLQGEDGRGAFENRADFLYANNAVYQALQNAIQALESSLAALDEKPEEVHAIVRRAAELRRDMAFVMEGDARGFVYWVERRGRGVFLQATPIDVSTLLTEALFEKVRSCVLTSATLAVAGSFEFIKRRLGLRYARERALDSHFDYSRQALLYIPPELPEPRQREFTARAAAEVCRILEATRGRAFVLFTSYGQMNAVYAIAARHLKFPLLLQGLAPRTALLDRFRSMPNAVLFATSSFWQGVDVPGKQLSCVIIDKLPFAVPTDPVIAARLRLLAEDGGAPFIEYQVPQAILALKQGFGRLIRSKSDRGVLAILDPRILTKNYGTIFLESLPDYIVTRDISQIGRFLEQPKNVRSDR